ncbi:MAG: FUSC family protein [Stellaceae bacterium]
MVLRGIPGALAAELGRIELTGPRGLEALEAALSVSLAVLAALAVHSDDPWWAGISAFMVTRASFALALSRGLMRVAGSIVGAVLGVVALGLFAYQPLPFCVFLFVLSCVGFFGFATSSHGYAWLIGAVTGNLVMLMAFTAPQGAFTIAVDRVADVVLGTAASILVCALMPAPPEPAPPPAAAGLTLPPLAFWRRRYGAELQRWLPGKWPIVMHVLRGGLTVMLLPALADWLAPVSPVTMGLTVVMVMSIPTTAIIGSNMTAVVEKAAHRAIGCLIGALIGLACLAFVGSDFLLWIALLVGGVWLCSQIQTGTTGVSYIGTQALFAFLMSMVQGQGPPLTISPGFERLVGVMGGLSILFVMTLILSLIPISEPADAGTG